MENSKELNCHVEISNNGLRFSYSGDAETQFNKGVNLGADTLWAKLTLVFSEYKWEKKYKVKNAKEFFRKYTYADVLNNKL